MPLQINSCQKAHQINKVLKTRSQDENIHTIVGMSKNRKFVGMWADKEELISLGTLSYKQKQADHCILLLRKKLLAALKGP